MGVLHSELQALLEGVKNHPEEESVRLLVADWLEEHATQDAEHARADFIRVQCQLARLNAKDPARQPLQAREQTLLSSYAPSWVEEWKPWIRTVRDDVPGWWFDRGLLRFDLSGLKCLQ